MKKITVKMLSVLMIILMFTSCNTVLVITMKDIFWMIIFGLGLAIVLFFLGLYFWNKIKDKYNKFKLRK
jgi:uncharacterized membrane protein